MKAIANRRGPSLFLVLAIVLLSFLGASRLALAQDIPLDPSDVAAATAATTPTATSGCSTNAGWSADADTFKGIVGTLLSPFNAADSVIANTAKTYASSVMSNAATLGGLLATTYIMWSLLKFMADGNGNYGALMIDSMAPVCIVSGVLANYSGLITGLQNLFTSMIPAQGGISSQIATLAQGFMGGIATALKAMWNSLGCGGDSGISVYLHAFFVGLLLIIAALLAIVALGEIVGVLFTGSVLMGVGIAVGPYFIATGVCKWSSDYMTKWLNFLMAALFYKSLISIVLYLVTGVVNSVVTTVSNNNGTTGFSIGNAVALIGIMWILRHVFLSIPGIAAALLGGGHHGAPSFNAAVDSGMNKAAAANQAFKKYSDEKAKQKIQEQKQDQEPKGQSGEGQASGPSAQTQGPQFSPLPSATLAGGSGGSSGAGSEGNSGQNRPNFAGTNKADATDVSFREVSGGQTGTAGSGGFQVD